MTTEPTLNTQCEHNWPTRFDCPLCGPKAIKAAFLTATTEPTAVPSPEDGLRDQIAAVVQHEVSNECACGSERTCHCERLAASITAQVMHVVAGLAARGAVLRSERDALPDFADGREARDTWTDNARQLWSMIDWTLWGHGLNDRAREPIATAMVQAIPPTEVERLVPVMLAWRERRGWPTLHEEYAKLRDQIERLTAERDAYRDADRQSRTNWRGAVKANMTALETIAGLRAEVDEAQRSRPIPDDAAYNLTATIVVRLMQAGVPLSLEQQNFLPQIVGDKVRSWLSAPAVDTAPATASVAGAGLLGRGGRQVNLEPEGDPGPLFDDLSRDVVSVVVERHDDSVAQPRPEDTPRPGTVVELSASPNACRALADMDAQCRWADGPDNDYGDNLNAAFLKPDADTTRSAPKEA